MLKLKYSEMTNAKDSTNLSYCYISVLKLFKNILNLPKQYCFALVWMVLESCEGADFCSYSQH
jgi:hypothetical protein